MRRNVGIIFESGRSIGASHWLYESEYLTELTRIHICIGVRGASCNIAIETGYSNYLLHSEMSNSKLD